MKMKFLSLALLLSGYACFAHDTLVDPSKHKRDYHTVITVVEREYPGTLAGKIDARRYDPKKWYLNTYFIDSAGKLVKAYSSPAQLLVLKDKLDEEKPKLLQFIPRVATASGDMGWDHELLAIEGKDLIKYSFWAEEDKASGKFTASVDLGKRTPIATIDVTYEPWADKEGNIYFKRVGKFFKWDPVSENAKQLISEPKKEDLKPIVATIEGDEIVAKVDGKDIKTTLKADFEIIDPLAIDDEKLLAPYKGFGTHANPIDRETYIRIIEGHVAPGMILALNKVQDIIAKPALSDTEKAALKSMLAAKAEAFEKSKELIKELKQVMREKGVKSLVKKWLTDEEVKSILIALDPNNAASRGIGMTYYTRGSKKGQMSFDHNGHIKIIEDGFEIPWGLYRSYKDAARKGTFDKMDYWENFAAERAKELKDAVIHYAAKVIGDNQTEFLMVLQPFLKKQPTPKDIEAITDLKVELALDYLVSLTEEKLDEVLAKLSEKTADRTKYKLLVNTYRDTMLSAVKK